MAGDAAAKEEDKHTLDRNARRNKREATTKKESKKIKIYDYVVVNTITLVNR